MVKTIANRIFLDKEKNIYSVKLSEKIHDFNLILENLKDYSQLFHIHIDKEDSYYIITLKLKDNNLSEKEIEELIWLLSFSSIKK